MPLHLLGKKSWNVYNPENIARVQRDEAAAKAENERAEREAQSDAAASRLQALRGEVVLETQKSLRKQDDSPSDVYKQSANRKRRKLAGENDTDRDIRLARSDLEVVNPNKREAAIVDSKGHIDLIQEGVNPRQPQHGEAQEETQTGMRFKDAAGFKSDGTPWYTTRAIDLDSERSIGKDVWGNEDPRRKDREQQRMITNDPLLAMRKGVKQLRENEKQRKEWIAQRERDLYEVEVLAREKEKRRRRSSDRDSLEDFSLDAPSCEPKQERDSSENHRRRHHHRRRHEHRHRSRSPGREHRHYRHRSRTARGPAAD